MVTKVAGPKYFQRKYQVLKLEVPKDLTKAKQEIQIWVIWILENFFVVQ